MEKEKKKGKGKKQNREKWKIRWGKESRNGKGNSPIKRFSTYEKDRRVDKCDIYHFKDKPHVLYYFYKKK